MEKNPKKTKMHLTKKKRKKSKNVGLDSLEFGGSERKIPKQHVGGDRGSSSVRRYLVGRLNQQHGYTYITGSH